MSLQPVDQDLVQAKIARKDKTVSRIPGNKMGMWAFLTLAINTRSTMLNRSAGGFQTAVGFHRQHRHPPTSVVGYQHAVAGVRHSQVTGAGSARSLLVQKGQLPGLRFHVEST